MLLLIYSALIFLVFAVLPKAIFFPRLQGLLLLLTGGSGLAIALRQIYLQHLPTGEAPACGPGLSYLFDTLPWHQAVAFVLSGSGECAVVDWRFLGFSMAEWSALALMGFCFYSIYFLCSKDL